MKLDTIPHPVKYARPWKSFICSNAIGICWIRTIPLIWATQPPLIPPGGHDCSKEHLHRNNRQPITLPFLKKQLCKMLYTVYFVSICYDSECMRSNYCMILCVWGLTTRPGARRGLRPNVRHKHYHSILCITRSAVYCMLYTTSSKYHSHKHYHTTTAKATIFYDHPARRKIRYF